MTITISSDAFSGGRPIPKKYSQDGDNVSPPLRFENVPEKARGLVLIADDPDAPTDEPWVHWVMYSIPPSVDSLPVGVKVASQPGQPAGAVQGRNTGGTIGYDGPAPPKGHGVHHYHFKVYAIDTDVKLEPAADKNTVLTAIRDHVIDEGELVGTYER